jgi:two-component system sensor histidine kinase UhpB
MWKRLSLRARINVLLALVLALGLAINVARLVLEAGPRVQAEDQSVIRLAREFIQSIGTGLSEAPDPEARLDQIVQDLNRLRHVGITRQTQTGLAEDRGKREGTAEHDDARSPPPWFSRLVHPEKTSVSVSVSINGKPESLVITSHPDDEMREIWDGVVTQLEVGSAIAIALFLVTSMVIGRALTPLGALSQAMTEIEAGRYQARVESDGAPELAAICAKLNHLAGVLATALDDKRRLAERVVSLQDRERKEIASELHDEFGPYLFALRAHASALMRLSDVAEPGANTLRKHGAAILEQVDALQQFNRRILEKLRPVGLAELGLHEALGALLRLWREAHPEVRIEMTITNRLGESGEAVDLTIYRVVQEALTNVFRHANATTVKVTIESADQPMSIAIGRSCILVQVRDNGRGIDSEHRLGLGLIGMRERVWALGGTFTVETDAAGVTVEAMIPTDLRDSFSRNAEDREIVPVVSGKLHVRIATFCR